MSGHDVHDLVVVGDLRAARGFFDGATAVDAVIDAHFDNATNTWAVTTADGRRLTGRVLIDATASDDDTVAAHGVPNHFRIPGPHTRRQARYVAGCLDALRRGGSTRIEARSRVRVHRLLPTRGASRFYLTGPVAGEEFYDGPATAVHDGADFPARVRLTGHLDPIDGQYHWQGTLYADIPGQRVTGSRVTIRIGTHSAGARISEQTPWGTLAVIGAAGYPPFALADTAISLPGAAVD